MDQLQSNKTILLISLFAVSVLIASPDSDLYCISVFKDNIKIDIDRNYGNNVQGMKISLQDHAQNWIEDLQEQIEVQSKYKVRFISFDNATDLVNSVNNSEQLINPLKDLGFIIDTELISLKSPGEKIESNAILILRVEFYRGIITLRSQLIGKNLAKTSKSIHFKLSEEFLNKGSQYHNIIYQLAAGTTEKIFTNSIPVANWDRRPFLNYPYALCSCLLGATYTYYKLNSDIDEYYDDYAIIPKLSWISLKLRCDILKSSDQAIFKIGFANNVFDFS